QVDSRWKQLRAQGEHTIPALVRAADSVLDEQTEKLAIQRRFSTDMREIWFMQPRFERRSGKAVYRMIEQPRFRAACDFLQLRAAAGEFDSVLAQWWMDLANADDAGRAEMIEELARLPRDPAEASAPRKRRRRPRRPPAAHATPSEWTRRCAPMWAWAPTWATPQARCAPYCANWPPRPASRDARRRGFIARLRSMPAARISSMRGPRWIPRWRRWRCWMCCR